MSVTDKFTLQVVTIGSTQINQLKDLEISPQISKLFEYGSGTVDPTFAGIDSEEPIITFSTTAIKKITTAVNINSGLAVNGTTAKVTCWFQRMAPGGTRQTGASALKVEISAGILVIAGVNAGDGQVATATVMLYAASIDGETAPLTYTDNATLPTLAVTDQLYTIGPAVLNAVTVGAIESFNFDPKIMVRRNRGDGEAYPTYTFIMRRGSEGDGPSINVTTRHLQKAVAGSTQPVTTTTTVALRALKAGTTREALTAMKHILFTMNAGTVIVQQLGARDGDEGVLALDFAGVATASLPAFSVTTDVALA